MWPWNDNHGQVPSQGARRKTAVLLCFIRAVKNISLAHQNYVLIVVESPPGVAYLRSPVAFNLRGGGALFARKERWGGGERIDGLGEDICTLGVESHALHSFTCA